MNDELPTPERLRRIERGVERRIGLRRLVARRVAVGAAVLVLIGGGFALLRPVAGGASSTSAAGSSAAETVAVQCHGMRTVRAEAVVSGLPGSAVTACARAERVAQPQTANGSGASSTGSPSALCRARNGVLHVYPGAPAVCVSHGMTPYAK